MTKCLDDQIMSVAASRKPNSVHLRSRLHASFGVTIIPLVLSSLTGSSDRPGGLRRAACGTPPYLVLLRAGFCLPPVLPRARCALTAPFHHCLCVARACASTARSAVYFLCHYPSSCPDRALPGALPCGVRTFLSRRSPQSGRRRSDRLAHCDEGHCTTRLSLKFEG